MPTHTIELPAEQITFIRSLLETGRFQDENEVLQAALELLEYGEAEYQANLKELRAEVQKGIDAIDEGRYIELNSRKDIDAYFEDVKRRGMERLAREKNVPQASTQRPGQ